MNRPNEPYVRNRVNALARTRLTPGGQISAPQARLHKPA